MCWSAIRDRLTEQFRNDRNNSQTKPIGALILLVETGRRGKHYQAPLTGRSLKPGRTVCALGQTAFLLYRAGSRSLGQLEQLEQRNLLSVAPPVYEGALLPTLDDSVQLNVAEQASSTPYETIDQGDYYWADGVQVPLLRRTDEFVVGLVDSGVSRIQVFSPNAEVTTWDVGTKLDSAIAVVTPASEIAEKSVDSMLADLSGSAEIEWAAPVFVSSETGMELWPSDQIVVRLADGVDPASYFSGDSYAGYQPMPCRRTTRT